MDFWYDVSIGAIGSFIGVLGALLIYLLQTKTSKKTVIRNFRFRLEQFQYLINDLEGQLKMIEFNLDHSKDTGEQSQKYINCMEIIKEINRELTKIQPYEIPKDNWDEYLKFSKQLKHLYLESVFIARGKLQIMGGNKNTIEHYCDNINEVISMYKTFIDDRR